jgi:hypothetical protein
MKKNVVSVFLIVVISLISMSFRSSSSVDNSAGYGTLKILKGTLINSDKDKGWDLVTFGIDGFNFKKDVVSQVNFLDKQGSVIAVSESFTSWSEGGDSWYAIDLDHIKLPKEFILEVHVVSLKWWNSSSVFMVTDAKSPITAPIDPEETILIVKYP